ncbi:hypothetical protein EOT10_36375 [Streptomyces antnestii]|uniref:Uncharacterized protein n=1 Tax=Streptomyces antnestii TaxID=2494256 RepID=A0A3S2V8I9_9ACTN|nr:hypothetical protein EOT10_36375 [Streptomyces sp. San01]
MAARPRKGGQAPWKSSRVEICIAVADWARGPTIWAPGVPGGESTGATRRRQRQQRGTRAKRTRGRHGAGPGAGMVAGWG